MLVECTYVFVALTCCNKRYKSVIQDTRINAKVKKIRRLLRLQVISTRNSRLKRLLIELFDRISFKLAAFIYYR